MGGILTITNVVNGMSNGPPECTLYPRHNHIRPQGNHRNWTNHFEVRFFKIHHSLLLDPRNTTGRVDPRPNGLFGIVRAKALPNQPFPKTIRGFAVQAMPTRAPGHDAIEFSMINRNLKLKRLHCPRGEKMLAHRNANLKYRVSFFVKNNLDYERRGLQRFRATIVEDYATI